MGSPVAVRQEAEKQVFVYVRGTAIDPDTMFEKLKDAFGPEEGKLTRSKRRRHHIIGLSLAERIIENTAHMGVVIRHDGELTTERIRPKACAALAPALPA